MVTPGDALKELTGAGGPADRLTKTDPQRSTAMQLGILALISAREDGCNCRAAQALRRQVNILFDSLLKGVTDDDAGQDSPPAAGPGSA